MTTMIDDSLCPHSVPPDITFALNRFHIFIYFLLCFIFMKNFFFHCTDFFFKFMVYLFIQITAVIIIPFVYALIM